MSPSSGPVTGGTVVHLEGYGFGSATEVHFGDVQVTDVDVTSSRSLDAVTPAHAEGGVEVWVADSDGSSDRDRHYFAFEPVPNPQPRVRQLTPYRGAQGGGTRVTVTGTGFTHVTQVTFGNVPGTNLVVASDSQLQVTTPPSPGNQRAVLTVRVHTAETSSYANWQSFFTFDDGPRIEVAPVPRDADSMTPWPELRDLACPGAGVCVAVGDYRSVAGNDLRRGLAEHLVGGEWRPVPLPLATLSNGSIANVAVHSISCPTTAACIAVGAYSYPDVYRSISHPVAFTWDGTSWSIVMIEEPDGPEGGLDKVVCATASSCVALGQRCVDGCVPLAFTMTGTQWAPRTIAPPPGVANILVNDFDCWAATGCVAVGRYRTTSTDYDSTAPLVFRYDGTTWTGALGVLPPDSSPTVPDTELQSVSCTSQGCRAFGRHLVNGEYSAAYLSTVTSAGETVSTVAFPPDANLYYYPFDTDIDCATFDSCRAITNYRRTDSGYSVMDVSIVNGAATVAELPDLRLASVTCPTTAGCAATADRTLAQLGATRTVAIAPDPLAPGPYDQGPSKENAFATCVSSDLFRVTADSPTTAVALGGCNTGSVQFGVLMTGIPVPVG